MVAGAEPGLLDQGREILEVDEAPLHYHRLDKTDRDARQHVLAEALRRLKGASRAQNLALGGESARGRLLRHLVVRAIARAARERSWRASVAQLREP